jgi:putative FmdB family regulatory protein
MPTYDYKCSNCNHTFEYFQPMSAEPLSECPKCKGKLKRIIGTGSGPIFKGSGFYQTDYKSKSQQSKKNNESENKPLSTEKKVDKNDKK